MLTQRNLDFYGGGYIREAGGFFLNQEKGRAISAVNVPGDTCKCSSESWRQIIAQLPGGTESKLPNFEDWNIWCFLSPCPPYSKCPKKFCCVFLIYKHNRHNKEIMIQWPRASLWCSVCSHVPSRSLFFIEPSNGGWQIRTSMFT